MTGLYCALFAAGRPRTSIVSEHNEMEITSGRAGERSF